MNTTPTINPDHTVTYWSVYNQVWKRYASHVPAAELAAMTTEDREAVIVALAALDERTSS